MVQHKPHEVSNKSLQLAEFLEFQKLQKCCKDDKEKLKQMLLHQK